MAAGSEVALLANLTHERLIALGLPGMAKLSKRKGDSPISPLFFEAQLGLMVARAAAARDAKRLATRPKFAAWRQRTPQSRTPICSCRTALSLRSSKSSSPATG
jgi:hypothetical protein